MTVLELLANDYPVVMPLATAQLLKAGVRASENDSEGKTANAKASN